MFSTHQSCKNPGTDINSYKLFWITNKKSKRERKIDREKLGSFIKKFAKEENIVLSRSDSYLTLQLNW